jgi:hypothetical protein
MGELINTFWTEFEEFQARTGPYANREFIFKNNLDLRTGSSHIWHKKNTLKYTMIFGKFACRVCSKILGIGSAERSWGDVKHLKTNKRAHLSGERVKKQATIFGASCVEQAELKRNKSAEDAKCSPYKYWRDDDFDKAFGMDMFVADEVDALAAKPSRIFKAWMEDWEEGATRKRDPVSEVKLLRKYGAMQWFDPDTNMMYYSDKDALHWSRRTKHGGGYSILAYDKSYMDDDPDKANHVEPWVVSVDLIECIGKFYKENPGEGVQVVDETIIESSEGKADSDGGS